MNSPKLVFHPVVIWVQVSWGCSAEVDQAKVISVGATVGILSTPRSVVSWLKMSPPKISSVFTHSWSQTFHMALVAGVWGIVGNIGKADLLALFHSFECMPYQNWIDYPLIPLVMVEKPARKTELALLLECYYRGVWNLPSCQMYACRILNGCVVFIQKISILQWFPYE